VVIRGMTVFEGIMGLFEFLPWVLCKNSSSFRWPMVVLKEEGLVSVGKWRRKMDRVASGEVLRRFACFMFLAFLKFVIPNCMLNP